jgi:poly(A) polymerase
VPTEENPYEDHTHLPHVPRIIPRAEHNISRANISEYALKVLYRLDRAGFKAYLVGGGVRDLLLGREPKDFDVATDARPEQVRELFRNCRLIGRRFRLAHVHYGAEIVEVATFRAHHEGDPTGGSLNRDGRILRDNVYGDIDEDAWRRDFTVNALYYNIRDFSVEDFVGGMDDMRNGWIRLIGDPEERYREDAVRMLRAIRFAVKCGFNLEPETERPIASLAPLLGQIPPARLFEEVLKLFLGGYAVQTFEALRHHGLFGYLFPDVEKSLAEEEAGFPKMLLVRALENADARVAEGKPVTPTFLFAAFLWCPMQRVMEHYAEEGAPLEALLAAGDEAISRQVARVALPRRITQGMRELWELQERLLRSNGRRAQRFVEDPRFRAAYDFLLLRAEAGEPVGEMADWWTEYLAGAGGEGHPAMVRTEPSAAPRRRRRSRRNRSGGEGGVGELGDGGGDHRGGNDGGTLE